MRSAVAVARAAAATSAIAAWGRAMKRFDANPKPVASAMIRAVYVGMKSVSSRR
jgi:hypothetical protein